LKSMRVLLLLVVLGFSLRADTRVFTFNREFSGGTPPAGATLPWLTATFTQVASGVLLTMSTSGLVGTEFVTWWGFNRNFHFGSRYENSIHPLRLPASLRGRFLSFGSRVRLRMGRF